MANFVARDDIWKIHINRESTASKSWKTKWGFLTSEYQEMFDNSKTMRENAKPKTVFPPIEDGKPLVQSGSKIVPKTAAQCIGWKVGTEQRLNPFGNAANEAKPRQNLGAKLGWPKEALL
ncbi:ciliary microtubule inner protein 1-like [Bolinopsis microptera]|uniref:ciliary microtubule inner protein 1-like n=1 Tax=Bolinopsis microptera TaxID=2820187 RepID=UPI0030793791